MASHWFCLGLMASADNRAAKVARMNTLVQAVNCDMLTVISRVKDSTIRTLKGSEILFFQLVNFYRCWVRMIFCHEFSADRWRLAECW